MDSGSIITGLVIVLICIFPFIAMSMAGKRREKKLLQSLNAIAEKHHTEIAEHDCWGQSAVGISVGGKHIFSIRNINGSTKICVANLAEIQKCRIVNINRSIKSGGSEIGMTDRIELAFSHRDKNIPDTILEFYNTEYDSLSLTGELQLAQKWCKIVNDAIASL